MDSVLHELGVYLSCLAWRPSFSKPDSVCTPLAHAKHLPPSTGSRRSRKRPDRFRRSVPAVRCFPGVDSFVPDVCVGLFASVTPEIEQAACEIIQRGSKQRF